MPLPTYPTPTFSAYNPATFTGRDAETADLTALLRGDRRVVAIAGLTGIGKTALAERVVATLRLTADTATLPYYRFSLDDRSLTPDFSSSGAALLRTLGEEPTLEDQKDPANLLAHILARLCSQPCRLQIDSLERLLRGNEQEGWSEFCDPLWLDLLGQFLYRSHCPSQLLLTSQDIPGDLDAVGSRYPQFWHCQTLQGLNPEEQQDLFLNLGLPQDAESLETLRRIGAFYDGHPLVLQVIADEIRQPPFQGNLARYWTHYAVKFAANAALITDELDRSCLIRRRVRLRVEQALQRLPSPAHRMLCTSAVFRRPVPIAFWQAMLTDDDPQAAFDTLHDRRLVEYTLASDNTLLVRQHNLVRSVARDLLKADIPTWHAAERQAAHLWLTAYKPAPDVPNLETVRGYLEAFEHYCNIEDWEAAKTLFTQTIDTPAKSTLYWQLDIWGYLQEEIQLCKKLLGRRDPSVDLQCWRGIGHAYIDLGNYAETIKAYENCLRIARDIGDSRSEGNALGNLGNTYYRSGNYPQALGFYQQQLIITQEIGDRRGEGNALGGLGIAYDRLGNYSQAIDFLQQYLTIAREIGNRRGEGDALCSMGATQFKLEQYPESLTNSQSALKIFQEIGDRADEAEALKNLAELHQALGEVEVAQQYCQQALALATELGIPLKAECEALQLKMQN